MVDMISIKCSNCGASIEQLSTSTQFRCEYCNTIQTIIFKNGEYQAQILHDIRHGVDRTAAELAIKRLSEEIKQLENELLINQKEKEGILNESYKLKRRISSKKPPTWNHFVMVKRRTSNGCFLVTSFRETLFLWIAYFIFTSSIYHGSSWVVLIITLFVILGISGSSGVAADEVEELNDRNTKKLELMSKDIEELDAKSNNIKELINKKKQMLEQNRRILDTPLS